MKLVEIKNSLAKLYYEPIDFPLVISDFLTIDDGNQKILSQVVSIESTTKEDVNCAILKFTLDLDEANKQSPYSGYVPALDAIVSKTKPSILKEIFCSSKKPINLGCLTNSSKIELQIGSDILDNFLYIQSDKHEETELILEKIINYNSEESKKTLIIKYEDITDYANTNIVTLGKELKLPVNNDVINYIYENDLQGLTVEQKSIVQDILLEIQEYINTLEDGYIPFKTLLEVVNDIYETDKSTGVILLRNKLLKYQQLDIFASTIEEINALYTSLKNNPITVLDLSLTNTNWKKEATSFALRNIDEDFYVITKIKDNIADESLINELYKQEYIKPILASDYETNISTKIKSYAKNLILFKSEKQQKVTASYNSFLMKLAPLEFIVSGEATYYTPLIIQKIPDKIENCFIEQTENDIEAQQEIIQENDQDDQLLDLIDDTDDKIQESLYDIDLESDDQEAINNDDTEDSEIKAIFDESVEQEIAKDVDQMFTTENDVEDLPDVDFDILADYSEENDIQLEQITDNDLDFIEETNNLEKQNNNIQTIEASQNEKNEELIDEFDAIDNIQPIEDLEDSESGILENTGSLLMELPETEIQNNILENLTENDSLPSVPIYQPEPVAKSKEGLNITEGNIVYHEKYGRGIVEELFNYGKRTLCSIQFDNVGRRLLDPNLAELKQM